MLVPAQPAIVAEVIWRMEEVPALSKVCFLGEQKYDKLIEPMKQKSVLKWNFTWLLLLFVLALSFLSRQCLLICTCQVWFCP